MSKQPAGLQRDAARTKAEILAVATEVFARNGFSGARVDEIAAKTSTTKRMIYYYFGGKAELYTAVLEEVYAAIRSEEQRLELEDLSPVQALTKLIRFAFDYHGDHPELCRIVAIENIHQAEHLAQRSTRAIVVNTPIVTLLDGILARGRAEGLFPRRADGMEVHLMVMAWAMYTMNHRASIRAGFAYDMGEPGNRARLRQIAVDSVLAWLGTPDEG